jgi:flagellar motor switch protein FliG
LSDLVDFEDLGLLDGGDLRSVFDQAPDSQVLEALVGSPPALRCYLLAKLSATSASRLEDRIKDCGPVPADSARVAQRAVVEVLCRLSRGGQVAFDDPDDMVA